MSERRFPILRGGSIPWDLIAPHEKQALENHCGQTLERLAERGGLGTCEAVAVLEDRRWKHMDERIAGAQLQEKVENWHRATAAALQQRCAKAVVDLRFAPSASVALLVAEELASLDSGSFPRNPKVSSAHCCIVCGKVWPDYAQGNVVDPCTCHVPMEGSAALAPDASTAEGAKP